MTATSNLGRDEIALFPPLNDRPILAFLIIVPLVIHLGLAAAIPLTEDEAYYRLWALAPAMSYLDHPPMVGWMMAIGRMIAGDNELGLRLPAVIATAICTVALWRMAVLLTGRQTAILAVILAAVVPLLGVGAIVMTPDTPSVLFYLLGGWALAELVASRNANWWLAVGLFAGLGLLSKYTNFFFGIAIIIWLLAVRSNWRWFSAWQLYAGGALALLLFAPVMIWNFEYDFASFTKQFGRVSDVRPFKISWTLEMWGALLLLAGPGIVWFAARGALAFGRRFRSASDPSALLPLALTLPLLLYFVGHALHGRVLPNWLAPIYPMLAILAAAGIADVPSLVYQRRSAWVAAAVSAAITVLIYAHALVPFYVSATVKDPTHQMRGWPDFKAAVEDAARRAGATYIATTSYGTTGQLAFYLDAQWPVFQLNERLRYVHLPEPEPTLLAKTGLVVELTRRLPLTHLRDRFTDIRELGQIERRFRGETLQTYAVYAVSKPIEGAPGLRYNPARHRPSE